MRQKILLFLLLAWVMSSTGAYAQTVGTNFKEYVACSTEN